MISEYEAGVAYIVRRNGFWNRVALADLQELAYSFAVIAHRYGNQGAAGMSDALVEMIGQMKGAIKKNAKA